MFGEGQSNNVKVLKGLYESPKYGLNRLSDEELYVAHRGEASTDKDNAQDYGGIFYTNSFKVFGGPIYLRKVGFFGPFKQETAEYSAQVTVDHCLWDRHYNPTLPWWSCPLLAWALNKTPRPKLIRPATARRREYLAKKGEIWWVTFEEPVRIPEKVWVSINFCINVKGTAPMASIKPGTQALSADFCTELGSRRLEFAPGSRQMPVLGFTVYDPCGSGANTEL